MDYVVNIKRLYIFEGLSDSHTDTSVKHLNVNSNHLECMLSVTKYV